MKECDIEIHSVDDWEGLYENGRLVKENHSDVLSEWLMGQEMPVLIKSLNTQYHADDDLAKWVETYGRMPADIETFMKDMNARSTKAEAQVLYRVEYSSSGDDGDWSPYAPWACGKSLDWCSGFVAKRPEVDYVRIVRENDGEVVS